MEIVPSGPDSPDAIKSLVEASPRALQCQEADGHVEMDKLLAVCDWRDAHSRLAKGDAYMATMLVVAMAQTCLDRIGAMFPDGKTLRLAEVCKDETVEPVWANTAREVWAKSSPCGTAWYRKAREWLAGGKVSKDRIAIDGSASTIVWEVFLQGGRRIWEKIRANAIQAQLGPRWAKLQAADIEKVSWGDVVATHYVQDAGVLVELAGQKAVVIGKKTETAVAMYMALRIVKSLKLPHMRQKMVTKTTSAWEEMIRAVVAATAIDQQVPVCLFLTRLALNKADFDATPVIDWKHELFWIGELSPSSQALLEDKLGDLTPEHFFSIGQICAVHTLFNTMDGLAEQVAVSGGQVVSLLESVNTVPEGLGRIIYTEKVRMLVETLFSNDQAQALEALRASFNWGAAKLSDSQMAQVLAGIRESFNSIARQPLTRETLTKPAQKAFDGIQVDCGLYDLEDITNFLSDVQHEIQTEVSGDRDGPAPGMCRAFSSTR